MEFLSLFLCSCAPEKDGCQEGQQWVDGLMEDRLIKGKFYLCVTTVILLHILNFGLGTAISFTNALFYYS